MSDGGGSDAVLRLLSGGDKCSVAGQSSSDPMTREKKKTLASSSAVEHACSMHSLKGPKSHEDGSERMARSSMSTSRKRDMLA